MDYTKIPGYGMVVKGVPAIHETEEPPSAPDSIIVEDTTNKRLIETIGLFEEGEGNLQAGGSIHTISTGNGSESSTLIITDEDDEDLEQMIQVIFMEYTLLFWFYVFNIIRISNTINT